MRYNYRIMYDQNNQLLRHKSVVHLFSLVLMFTIVSGLTGYADNTSLEAIALSDKQWTGLAVSKEGRLFVNYPRWSESVPISAAELVDGKPVPYPNTTINDWRPGKDPAKHLVCVQALFIDAKNRLWILDPANPGFKGVVPGGPKLLEVNLTTNQVVRTYRFNREIALQNSYLNDVRVDTQREFAYITDSGDGALIVLNLSTGDVRRLLGNHPSTAAEEVLLTIGGKPWLLNGIQPRIHADGIAYDAGADKVYYQALTGRTMYRISGAALRQVDLSEKKIAAKVERVGETGASDGLIAGPGGYVYISALEHDAIFRTSPQGRVETVVQDERIAWPDSFSFGPDGKLYFTTSRIHEGAKPIAPYGIYRIAP